MKSIEFTIDGRTVGTQAGGTVLAAALESGLYIPHLCHHPDLRPAGACRLCSVEIEGRDGLHPSCQTEAAEGMRVRTNTQAVLRMRLMAMELLLSRHPADCTSCSRYLNCELQSVKQYVGISEELRVRRKPKPFRVNEDNPLFVHDFSRCILCGRCVRACQELRGAGVLHFVKQGRDISIGMPAENLAEAGCRFCGACVAVCPTGALRDKEELTGGKNRRAALLPCTSVCPAGIDVPGYLRFIREKDYPAAAALIREKAPFPEVLGYVCHHPCEAVCRRGHVDEPVAIRDLKRFAVRHEGERSYEQIPRRRPATGKRAAVIGSGPAGLTAAYWLARLGHGVTVFEALAEAGGMLRVGIPAYRLPREVVEREIENIRKAGVEIRTGTRVESLDALLIDDGYDAALIAVGAHLGQRVPIEGADCAGVLNATDFLRDVNLGKTTAALGKKVLVLGGGNVALDCARMAKRLGVDEVRVACLESRDALPASPEEVGAAEQEGVLINPSCTFTGIVMDCGRAAGVSCLGVESFEFDDEWRLHIETIDNSEHVLEADTIIFAIGQRPDVPFDIELNDRRFIECDPYTLETSQEGVFAAGDAVTGTVSVIDAVAAGRKGAIAMDRYLGGSGDLDEELAPRKAPGAWLGREDGFAARRRNNCREEEGALCEAKRCLQCDLRVAITPVKFWGDY